jgi:ABC-2 type transport system ATP-binding protein
MKPALQVAGITRSFGSLKAVDDVSFEVRPGQICGFIGPNGAGKTTTMRICSTLDIPDSGDVFVEGISVLEDPRGVRRRLGFMPDDFGSEANTPVSDYLDFFARARGLKGKARRKAISDVVDFTGLAPLYDKDTTALSKGMRQRAGLAVTLLHDPAVLILDEPAAGLDPRARVELRELLSIVAEMGKAVLISSHILTELSEICDVVAVIEAGQIRATGKVADIKRNLQPDLGFRVRCLVGADETHRFLLEQPNIEGVRIEGQHVVFNQKGVDEDTAALLARMVEGGLMPTEFTPVEADLEELFLSLTKGQIQ